MISSTKYRVILTRSLQIKLFPSLFNLFAGGMFHMAIVQLLDTLEDKGPLQYQMSSPFSFTLNPDQFHKVTLELIFSEERSALISHLIKVVIKRKQMDGDEEPVSPSPQVCTMSVGFISKAIAKVCSGWFPRLSFSTKVPCICGSSCEEYRIAMCTEAQCLHLIKLGNHCKFCSRYLIKEVFLTR